VVKKLVKKDNSYFRSAAAVLHWSY